ncbi:hypothetical protein CERSUDRAFT_90894 [Gelatoporia subvermispora B]|uniref:Uncharacterized protein n=1 Tax=Ceriporiopsis subvermispora (strain B) TaxID=914234 RepID=M2QYP1_CERS8|nr:hypothetical protein CERSUDRAFT_90894 [Gelatoporia subvermispora B]
MTPALAATVLLPKRAIPAPAPLMLVVAAALAAAPSTIVPAHLYTSLTARQRIPSPPARPLLCTCFLPHCVPPLRPHGPSFLRCLPPPHLAILERRVTAPIHLRAERLPASISFINSSFSHSTHSIARLPDPAPRSGRPLVSSLPDSLASQPPRTLPARTLAHAASLHTPACPRPQPHPPLPPIDRDGAAQTVPRRTLKMDGPVLSRRLRCQAPTSRCLVPISSAD